MAKAETKTKATTEETTANPQDALANGSKSPFTQAANMDINMAVGVLAQAAQLAHKAGVLTVNDSVLVARALELVTKPNENA